jgi:hypothetical protein
MAKPTYHLLLDRSEYRSTNIFKLEAKLRAWALGEGAKDFVKTNVVPVNEASEDMKEECYIDKNDKFDERRATNLHWYNKGLYIIETK